MDAESVEPMGIVDPRGGLIPLHATTVIRAAGEISPLPANEGDPMDICVGNLPRDVTGDGLRELFGPFGRVDAANVVVGRRHGESVGCGFVRMPSRNEAILALTGLNGRSLKGQVVTVTEVRPTEPSPGPRRVRCSCWSRKRPAAHGRRPGGL